MAYSRERNRNVDLNNLGFGTNRKPTDTKSRLITIIVMLVLMLLSAAGPAAVFVLLVFGIFAAIAGVMYVVFKSQVVSDGTNPAGSVKNKGFDIMRTIREKSEKEGDPMFKEARANQKRNLTAADYARLDRCSHEECLKSLLEAGIIDRSEYIERIHKLNCYTAHR